MVVGAKRKRADEVPVRAKSEQECHTRSDDHKVRVSRVTYGL